jgi:hypothetical protein
MYGCVGCQAWHRENDGAIFGDHLLSQSKHGISRIAMENTYQADYPGETAVPPVDARRVNVEAEVEPEAGR